jgi:predicted Zn-dependent protease with MMP-like domain
MMDTEEFAKLVADIGFSPVPEKFRDRINNVALLVEDEPSLDVRTQEELRQGETLLGLYQGVPHTLRGDAYGFFGVLPDTITLYRLPILTVAEEEGGDVSRVVRETIWHEVAHHFGLSEDEVRTREHLRDSEK